jgi:hypothetical protein
MSGNSEVQDLIAELTRLQLRQTEVIGRLTRLTETQHRETRTVSPHRSTLPEPTRKFAIGDRVRITNPRPFQVTTGLVQKIGTRRITVRTASGSNIVRAPKNLAPL